LEKKSNAALFIIDEFTVSNGGSSVLESIREQILFIRNNAILGKNPVVELNGRQFTYGIISSREFSSPDELKIKTCLDAVSEVLDSDAE
jgi:hypothetical protein